MKSAVSLLGCVVRLIGSRILLAVAIGVFVLGISFAQAQTPLQATASITNWVYCQNSETNRVVKPTGGIDGFTHQCGPVVANWGTLGTTTYSASGTTCLKFVEFAGGVRVDDPVVCPVGPVVAPVVNPVQVVGKMTGNVVSSFNGYNKNAAKAGIWGYFWYYFNIVRGSNLPWVLPTIPILFTARGKAQVMGHGMFQAYIVVGMYGTALPTYFPRELFQIKWEGWSNAAYFGNDPNTCSRSVTLDLPVNDPRQPYQVQVTANVAAYAPNVTTLNVTNDVSRASVYVDNPIISFDQNTFNARCTQQGKTPFTLSSYYGLQFSPNLNIR